MQLFAPRACAAPRLKRIVIASSAVVSVISFSGNVRADPPTAANAIELPDVTVQQASPTPAPAVAQKPKAKTRPKAATAAVKPSATATAPIATITPSPSPAARRELAPATGNAGTPSAAVASVPGASGAGAQAATGVDMARFESAPVFSVTDILHEVPGVSLKQGNGPRDMGISIRGSNARNGFGIRNIVILDDGFPVTQPDGLSRSDLIDPHAYAGVDVWRGPSSALFGNYATGGAINFRTFPGGAIDGVEYGIDVGGFNYLNNYVIGGKKGADWEASVFTSDVRGDGYFGYSAFNTQTVNALMTWKPSSTDTFTFKFINNTIDAELPFRISLNNFKQNSFQKGCATAAAAAPGCATINFSATGNTNVLASNGGDAVKQTAEEAGANRDDRRTIGGFRWEHAFDAATTAQVQVVVDDRDISQPTGATSAVGDYLSYNVSTGLTNRSVFAGLPTLSYLGAYWNYLPVDSKTYNVAPGGDARLGLLQSETVGSTTNFGVRAREEVRVASDVAVIAGAAVERTNLDGGQTSFKYNTNGDLTRVAIVSAERQMTNVAPEIGVLYTPAPEWQWRARVGTGYGTPQFSNLFVTPEGTPGNNTDLKSQRNVGFDLGGDWTPARGVTLSVTGFYEFYKDELVSQAPVDPTGSSFSFNAPASEHRGVEVAADFAITDGLRLTASFLHNDQYYTDYSELIAGAASAASRDGNKIPGVSPNEATARLSYDFANGRFKGIGAFAEYEWHDGFFMENANLLKAPGYDLVNINVHYNTEFGSGPVRSLMTYFEIRNLFDETYISSANNITDRVSGNLADATGSIYAGAPRTFFTGMKVRF